MDPQHVKRVRKIREWIKTHGNVDPLAIPDPALVTPEENLVRITWAHPRFDEEYDFKSDCKGWIPMETRLVESVSTPERLLALDCEMVQCENEAREVVRVCLVDRNLEVLIDTLVRPSKVVVEYLSNITGITAEDLEGVSVTQTDIQKQVQQFLTSGTIIVGHSLHNDLKALKIDYRRVIDTQYIFPLQGRPRMFTPALRDLCKAILGFDFRADDGPHDCLEDAKLPMKLVLHRLERGPFVVEIPYRVDEAFLSKLLLHKIPASVKNDDLESLFSTKLSYEVQDKKKDDTKYSKYISKYAVFKTKEDADSAFSSLQGCCEVDISGRSQKKVYLCIKGNSRKFLLLVRKMGFDTEDLSITSKLPTPSAMEAAAELSHLSKNSQIENGENKGVAETFNKGKRKLGKFEGSENSKVSKVARHVTPVVVETDVNPCRGDLKLKTLRQGAEDNQSCSVQNQFNLQKHVEAVSIAPRLSAGPQCGEGTHVKADGVVGVRNLKGRKRRR